MSIYLSTIIPAYNASQTIIESIESVLNECIRENIEFEIIIIDDGSTDNTLSILETYIKSSTHAQHLILLSQENQGVSSARNAGLKIAKGELIAFNDSDDRWTPQRLSKLLPLMQDGNIDLLAGQYSTIPLNTIKNIDSLTPISIKNQIFKNYFSPPASMLRTSILEKSGLFDPTMRYSEDAIFFMNIVAKGKAFILPEIVSQPIIEKKPWGDTGLSSNIIAMQIGEIHYIKFAYKNRYINCPIFIIAYIFSITKFLRRYIICNYSLGLKNKKQSKPNTPTL